MYKKLQRFREFFSHKKNRHRRTVAEPVFKKYGTLYLIKYIPLFLSFFCQNFQ
jgi:hypothetical protein